ncbi:MAG: DUF5106 domain-containing protein, partial [Flavobacteriales bacterium]|nr:DUF5106 domain-containing protein [Flavobacteriales bacterium]
MKINVRIVFPIILLINLLGLNASAEKNTGYELKFEIDGLASDTVYLVNYQGNKIMYFDTTVVDTKGQFAFKNTKKLKVGMYGLFYNGRILLQFIGKETSMKIVTDTLNYIGNISVEGSEENQTLYGFFQFAGKSNRDSQSLRKKLKSAKKGSDNAKEIKEELEKMHDAFDEYRNNIIDNKKNLFVSTLLKARIEPTIPKTPLLENGKKDSTFAYRYFKRHYFDNIDLSDRRLFRTDIMHDKVFYYLDKLTPMQPDSIIKSVDVILEGTKEDSITFRYFASKLLYRYDTSKVVGMSNVLFHIGNKYYLKDKAYWMDSTQMAKVVKRVEMLRYNQIGNQAIDLRLQDIDGNTRTISEIKSEFTILFFFDASCGHCKKTAPKLLD